MAHLDSLGRLSPTVDTIGRLNDYLVMTLTAVLTPAPEGGYIALNPETGSTTQGETVDEALANLREATGLFLEEFPMSQAGSPLLTTIEVATHA